MRYRFPEGITTSTTTNVIINVITTCVIITTLISITIIVTTLISTTIITIIWRPTIPRNSISNIFCWKKPAENSWAKYKSKNDECLSYQTPPIPWNSILNICLLIMHVNFWKLSACNCQKTNSMEFNQISSDQLRSALISSDQLRSAPISSDLLRSALICSDQRWSALISSDQL